MGERNTPSLFLSGDRVCVECVYYNSVGTACAIALPSVNSYAHLRREKEKTEKYRSGQAQAQAQESALQVYQMLVCV